MDWIPPNRLAKYFDTDSSIGVADASFSQSWWYLKCTRSKCTLIKTELVNENFWRNTDDGPTR